MTGFGRGEAERQGHCFTVEIKSVNHRYLDINIRTPRFLMYMEGFIRAEIKQHLSRGRVDVFVNYKETAPSAGNVGVSIETARQYVHAAEEIRKALKVKNDISLSSLMRMEGVITFEEKNLDEEILQSVLSEAIATALSTLVAARRTEGAHMVEDLLVRRDTLLGLLHEIETRKPLVVVEYKEKLRAKVEEYLSGTGVDENRFNTEILYFADKASIEEEIVRIRSHLSELGDALRRDTANGRSLDFLVQELNREFNTIGSKASDITITKAVLAAKAEVENIREQVQNIE